MPLADGVVPCGGVESCGGGVTTYVLLGVWAAIAGAAVGGMDDAGFTVVVLIDVLGCDGGAAVGVTVGAGRYCYGFLQGHGPYAIGSPMDFYDYLAFFDYVDIVFRENCDAVIVTQLAYGY